MKKLILGLLAIANLTVFAQTKDSTIMGAGYANDVFYSFATGEVKTEARNNWHIAFTSVLIDASIRINDGLGVKLYLASTDTSDFATIDTTGMMWDELHNSYTTWAEGAFNDGATGHPDYGWGNYNNVNHNVYGSKVYVLMLPNGDYKKIMIVSMVTTGDYTFKIADLDNSNLVVKTVNKMNYMNKNFFYYDAENDIVLDREPSKTDWDIVFTRYYGEIFPGTYYNLTGILLNADVKAAKAVDVDTATVDWNNYPRTDSIEVIGSDWKSFNSGTFTYEVADSSAYFIESKDGNLYKLLFKSFSGSSTGTTVFTKAIASGIGLVETVPLAVSIYPIPASNNMTIEMEETGQAELISTTGQIVKQMDLGIGKNDIQVSDLAKGVFLLKVTANNKVNVTRVVLQ